MNRNAGIAEAQEAQSKQRLIERSLRFSDKFEFFLLNISGFTLTDTSPLSSTAAAHFGRPPSISPVEFLVSRAIDRRGRLRMTCQHRRSRFQR